METSVCFESEKLKIEGRFDGQSRDCAAVITHPHPLYGGNMHNPVVETTARAYREKGFTTLCFNFRGVGQSQGHFDDGRGEGQDVLAALAFMAEMGFKSIDLAGYSFGAWINAHIASHSAHCKRLVLVSPPVAFMSFETVSALPHLALVTAGSRDEIGPPDQIRTYLPAWNPNARFEVIPAADHFYSSVLDRLEAVLIESL